MLRGETSSLNKTTMLHTQAISLKPKRFVCPIVCRAFGVTSSAIGRDQLTRYRRICAPLLNIDNEYDETP